MCLLQVKDQRKEVIVQGSLKLRAARAWLQQRWPLCLTAAFLLVLLLTAILQFRSQSTGRGGSDPSQHTIFASARYLMASAFELYSLLA